MGKKIISLSILLLIVFSFVFFEEKTRDVFYTLIQGPSFVLSGAGNKISSFLEFLKEIENLRDQNHSLREENRHLRSELASLLEFKKENVFLREALEAGVKEEYDVLFSRVVVRNFSEGFIIINKGRGSGVEKGMAVVDSYKNLMGRVEEVMEGFSRVRLITSRGESLPVLLQDGETTAEVEGQGGMKLVLSLVPGDEEIGKEEIIVTAGLSREVPKGLLVGRVEEVIASDLKPYQEARLEPAAFFDETEHVFVILDY